MVSTNAIRACALTSRLAAPLASTGVSCATLCACASWAPPSGPLPSERTLGPWAQPSPCLCFFSLCGYGKGEQQAAVRCTTLRAQAVGTQRHGRSPRDKKKITLTIWVSRTGRRSCSQVLSLVLP